MERFRTPWRSDDRVAANSADVRRVARSGVITSFFPLVRKYVTELDKRVILS